ncbi:acyltransferase family protein [Luteolibacter sp. Populi]|uniref:acyltransferase family protein n=1 Tax=Luteolibacter sp. Populi TaxID=3230487 RepID=UPI0034650532
MVLHHTGGLVSLNGGGEFAWNLFQGGAAGVDFFFVLSGFIIFHRHAREIGQRDKLAEYGWRRLVRVFPAYWIVTLAILPLYFLVPGYGILNGREPWVIFCSFLLLPINPGPLLFVGWTLTHELWFYLLFAGLIAVRGAWFRVAVGFWVVAMVFLAIAPIDDHLLGNAWYRAALSPLNLEFVLGCLAAWLLARLRSVPVIVWRALLWGGLAAFFLAAGDAGNLRFANPEGADLRAQCLRHGLGHGRRSNGTREITAVAGFGVSRRCVLRPVSHPYSRAFGRLESWRGGGDTAKNRSWCASVAMCACLDCSGRDVSSGN